MYICTYEYNIIYNIDTIYNINGYFRRSQLTISFSFTKNKVKMQPVNDQLNDQEKILRNLVVD